MRVVQRAATFYIIVSTCGCEELKMVPGLQKTGFVWINNRPATHLSPKNGPKMVVETGALETGAE